MELVLIRHTRVNVPSNICYGFSDVDVTETFEQEAQDIEQSLNGQCFDAIWSSPLTRCTKLTEALFPDREYASDSRLKELNFGDWEGLCWQEIYEQPYGKQWMDDFVQTPCPNGEAFIDLYNRAIAFYNEIKPGFDHKKVAIVTHGGILRALKCHFLGTRLKNAFNIKLNYGEIVRLNTI